MTLEVTDLSTTLFTRRGEMKAVDGLSLSVGAGETVALVGESGCGKSLSALSIMRLLPDPPARIVGGTVKLNGRDIVAASEETMLDIRGKEIGMIFQDPISSLNPVATIEKQIAEVLTTHTDLGRGQARARAHELLELVGMPDAGRRLDAYPHQLSGGMCQRVVIAMAIACSPSVLIADEPTTALDVTVQAQVLALLKKPPGRCRHGDDLHHPRSGRGGRDRRPRGGDVCRPQGRGGIGRRPLREPAAPLYGRPDRRDADPRHGPGRAAGRYSRHGAAAQRPAAGLRLRAALPSG